MVQKTRLVIPVILVMAGMHAGASPAAAHFSGDDSVDGNEIRYEDYSKYDGAHDNAITEWEALPGGVSIAPDSASTIADLELRDYSKNDGLCGYWDPRIGADLLNMNKYLMEGYGVRDRKACVLHEWGHAHGLAHSYNDQVMDNCPVSACGSTYISPQNHDKSDYNSLWG